ncbi:MAG: DUF1464 family protein [Gemmatimonadetes bacterium]|nr:DUF1464 family protein [Gemmatimonadota bacterium]
MTRVVGIDPGTVSLDLVGLEDGRVWLDRTLATAEALAAPEHLLALLTGGGPLDLVAGPSGYGLPLVPAATARDEDYRLAFLAADATTGGIGGLRRLARAITGAGLPMVFTPGAIHLPTIPSHRKLNRVDLGTADKVAAAALGVWDQARRAGGAAATSFVLLELGGAFTAALAVAGGAIVDGIGGTAGPVGWRSSGGWDGEVAFLAGAVTKEMLFRGGVEGAPDLLTAYLEGAEKAVRSLLASVPAPREILLSGRHATSPAVRDPLVARLSGVAPVRALEGFAAVAKQGAQGAALLADGLAGGRHRDIVAAMRLREARGTALDHLRVISPADARRRLGLP